MLLPSLLIIALYPHDMEGGTMLLPSLLIIALYSHDMEGEPCCHQQSCQPAAQTMLHELIFTLWFILI